MLNSNDEVWKDIPGYESRYQVSNLGKVRSIRTNHGKYQERLLSAKPRSTTCSYLYVQMWVSDHPHHMAVHRAVALAFIPNPDNKTMVNHLDGNKLNNNACNLEWVTCSENHRHAFANGLRNSEGVIARCLGQKVSQSSKYHNVSWDNARQKWKGCLKDKGKMVFQKRFDSEIEAAMYVNTMLDKLGITNRPRNIIT